MRKINKPNFDVKNILLDHKKHFTNKFNKHFDLINKNLVDNEQLYIKKCKAKKLTSISECDQNNFFNSEQMIKSYKYIYKSDSKYRNNIKNLAEGTCPLCDSIFGYRSLELDHILPKSKFCEYIITPFNIVPICKSCNNSKQEKFGSVEEGILNPYFNYYNLKEMLQFNIKIIDNDLKVTVDIIDSQTFINKYKYKDKDKSCLYNSYNKIKHHILLHNINETIKNKATICLNSTIIAIIKSHQLYKSGQEKFFNILENIKNENEQEFINEYYISNVLVDKIINYKNKSSIYNIIMSKIEQNLKEENIDEDFYV